MTRNEEIRKMAARERSVSEERAYIRAAEWADRTMLERACKWLIDGGYFVNQRETVEDFKKALTR